MALYFQDNHAFNTLVSDQEGVVPQCLKAARDLLPVGDPDSDGQNRLLLFSLVPVEVFPDQQDGIYDPQQEEGITEVVFPGPDIFRTDQDRIENTHHQEQEHPDHGPAVFHGTHFTKFRDASVPRRALAIVLAELNVVNFGEG